MGKDRMMVVKKKTTKKAEEPTRPEEPDTFDDIEDEAVTPNFEAEEKGEDDE